MGVCLGEHKKHWFLITPSPFIVRTLIPKQSIRLKLKKAHPLRESVVFLGFVELMGWALPLEAVLCLASSRNATWSQLAMPTQHRFFPSLVGISITPAWCLPLQPWGSHSRSLPAVPMGLISVTIFAHTDQDDIQEKPTDRLPGFLSTN